MKKFIVLLALPIILGLAGCKGNDVTAINKESQVQSEIKSTVANSTEANLKEQSTSKKLDVTIDSKERENLNKLFDSKSIEFYDASKRIAINNLHDINFYETIWYIDKEQDGCSLMFFEDGKYLLRLNRFGSDVVGTYEDIDEKTVKLKPVLLLEDPLYPEYCEEMILSFKKDLKNINGSDMLIREGTDDIFYSISCPAETGKEYIVDGYEVIKIDNIHYVVTNRTYLKEKPEEASNNKKVELRPSVLYFSNDPDILVNEYTTQELNKVFKKNDSLLKGMSVTLLAQTKDKYKIGEAEDYWYYVSYYYFEGVTYEGWIYGGNIEAVNMSKVDEYVQMLRNEIDSLL